MKTYDDKQQRSGNGQLRLRYRLSGRLVATGVAAQAFEVDVCRSFVCRGQMSV